MFDFTRTGSLLPALHHVQEVFLLFCFYQNLLTDETRFKPIRNGEISYNYPQKGRWILVGYRDAKRRGIYLALWNDPEGDSWFSIYQISWIKIKIKIFVNKRRQLDKVCLRFNSLCSWDHFLWFCCKFSKKIIFYLPVNTHKKKVRRFLGIFFVRLLHLSLKSKAMALAQINVSKRDAILAPVAKQWIAKDIPSYGSQPKRAKIAVHWFGKH